MHFTYLWIYFHIYIFSSSILFFRSPPPINIFQTRINKNKRESISMCVCLFVCLFIFMINLLKTKQNKMNKKGIKAPIWASTNDHYHQQIVWLIKRQNTEKNYKKLKPKRRKYCCFTFFDDTKSALKFFGSTASSINRV